MWNANLGLHYLREWGINKLWKMGVRRGEGRRLICCGREIVREICADWMGSCMVKVVTSCVGKNKILHDTCKVNGAESHLSDLQKA